MAHRSKNNPSQANTAPANQSTFTSPDEHLDISMLETWLWDAACAIRGSTDAPKFKDFILPLVFFKRLSDVFDDELLDMSRSTEMKPSPGRLSRQTLLRYKDVPVKRTTNLNYI